MALAEAELAFKGGPGSGNFGHAGRPGEVGGSAPGDGGGGGGQARDKHIGGLSGLTAREHGAAMGAKSVTDVTSGLGSFKSVPAPKGYTSAVESNGVTVAWAKMSDGSTSWKVTSREGDEAMGGIPAGPKDPRSPWKALDHSMAYGQLAKWVGTFLEGGRVPRTSPSRSRLNRSDCDDCGLTTKAGNIEGLAKHFEGEEHPFSACMAYLADSDYDDETKRAICGKVKALLGGETHKVERRVALKAGPDQQLAYAEVYTANDLDVHGEYMSSATLRKMAHGFLKRLIQKGSLGIDVDHDNQTGRAYVVESFYVEADWVTPFTPDSWVLGVKVTDPELWQSMKRGDRASFSFQAWVTKAPREVEHDGESTVSVTTQRADGHTHKATIQLDDRGNVVSGKTDVVDGHSHRITENVRTEAADGHVHLFDLPRRVQEAA